MRAEREPGGSAREVGSRSGPDPAAQLVDREGAGRRWAAALAGSPPDPLEPIMPEFEQTPEGRFAVLPDGTRVGLVAPTKA